MTMSDETVVGGNMGLTPLETSYCLCVPKPKPRAPQRVTLKNISSPHATTAR